MTRPPRVFFHLVLLIAAIVGAYWQAPTMAAGTAQARGIGQDAAAQAGPKRGGRRRPVGKRVRKVKPIRNEYIVVLDDDVIGEPGDGSPAESLADALVATYGGRVNRRFKHAINAFAATMTEAQATAMSDDVLVAYVEDDSEVSPTAVQSPATWGLDRIDQRPRTLNGSYGYTYTGSGVNVYVVDSGINTTHNEFGGRAFAMAGWDFVRDGRNGQDCYGHGTHVAGTIGGNTYGVAKRATLIAVRVLNCQGGGSVSMAIDAVDAIRVYGQKPAVVNMSLRYAASIGLDTAVTNSVNVGFTFVVAAGNDVVDACTVSPARAAGTITVGATNQYDQRASFSNWGRCVDVWAPGVDVISASHQNTINIASMSGTSMASPHVAGAAAIYLSAYPSAQPPSVLSVIQNTATANLLTGIGVGSPNRLLYSLMQY